MGAPFNDTEVEQIRRFFMANIDIQGSGAVVAAPDHNTGPGGDYYFHWERDGALTMDALLRTTKSLSDIDDKMQHYVQWVDKVQHQPDPHGIDIRTEPKYTIPDGKPFAGGWCRPQNDGPGLRGRTLSEYGLALIKEGKLKFVQERLWSLVTNDLDWVAANWKSNGCDLWEEVQSDDFFWNRYVDRASLNAGAMLAEKLGDAAAWKYRAAKLDIEKTLNAHFVGGFVFESQNRKKDAAVIEAFNVGDLSDGLFAPFSKEVLGTVVALNELFCQTFDINRQDNAAGIPGILYGRYEGDQYNGGNPWVLLTATLAQLVYRQAVAAVKGFLDHSLILDTETYALLQKAYGIDAGLLGKTLGNALLGVADGVMLRIKHHVQATGLHMAEQIGRNDGKMTSAKDLTWNYADILKAVNARSEYVALSTDHIGEATILV
jgi:glucoamylase